MKAINNKLRIENVVFTRFSATCGFVDSSNKAMIAGSASVWWLEINTILWPCDHCTQVLLTLSKSYYKNDQKLLEHLY